MNDQAPCVTTSHPQSIPAPIFLECGTTCEDTGKRIVIPRFLDNPYKPPPFGNCPFHDSLCTLSHHRTPRNHCRYRYCKPDCSKFGDDHDKYRSSSRKCVYLSRSDSSSSLDTVLARSSAESATGVDYLSFLSLVSVI